MIPTPSFANIDSGRQTGIICPFAWSPRSVTLQPEPLAEVTQRAVCCFDRAEGKDAEDSSFNLPVFLQETDVFRNKSQRSKNLGTRPDCPDHISS